MLLGIEWDVLYDSTFLVTIIMNGPAALWGVTGGLLIHDYPLVLHVSSLVD